MEKENALISYSRGSLFWETLPTFKKIREMDDVQVQYAVEKLVPSEAITVVYGPGGGFKTWFMLQLGYSVASGRAFLGRATRIMPVYYLDYENPLAVIKERALIIGPSDMRIWDMSFEKELPRFDKPKTLQVFEDFPSGLIIIDSLRSCQSADENSSKDMTAVMENFKALRKAHFTVCLIHHTLKGEANTYRGSTAVQDQCDHMLSIESPSSRSKQGEVTLKVKAGAKTRFEPIDPISFTFNPAIGLVEGRSGEESPDQGEHVIEQSIESLLTKEGRLNQNEICTRIGRKKQIVCEVLKDGEGKLWTCTTEGSRHEKIYELISPPLDGDE